MYIYVKMSEHIAIAWIANDYEWLRKLAVSYNFFFAYIWKNIKINRFFQREFQQIDIYTHMFVKNQI